MAAGTVLDLIGIVETVGECTPLTTRAGAATFKRPVQIKDNSNASIEVSQYVRATNVRFKVQGVEFKPFSLIIQMALI